MADTIYALAISMTPWALGAAMLYAMLYQPRHWHLEHHLFIIGSAAYMGYLWVALLMAGLQRYTVPVFSDWMLAWMTLSVVVCLGLGTYARLRTARIKPTPDHQTLPRRGAHRESLWFISALSLYLLVLSYSVFLDTTMRPATAWDTLIFWADHGHTFLNGQLNTQSLSQMPAWTHPTTIKYVGAWGAFAVHERSSSGLYLPWAILYLGTVMVCITLGKMLSGYWWLGMLVGIMTASSPIIQAHASLGGYADFWLASGLVMSLGWLAITYRRIFPNTITLVALTTLILISLAFIKGNGVAYTVILLSVMVVARAVTHWHWGATLGLIFLVTVAVLSMWTVGFDLSIGRYRLSLLPEENLIALGQRQATLSSNSWSQIAQNFYHSWVNNASFYSGVVVGAVVCVVALLTKNLRSNWLVLTSVLFMIVLTLFYGVGQHLNERQLFAYASPETDTSLSRFSQAIYLAAIMATLTAISTLFDNHRNSEQPAHHNLP